MASEAAEQMAAPAESSNTQLAPRAHPVERDHGISVAPSAVIPQIPTHFGHDDLNRAGIFISGHADEASGTECAIHQREPIKDTQIGVTIGRPIARHA
jgi:hypothetical protein